MAFMVVLRFYVYGMAARGYIWVSAEALFFDFFCDLGSRLLFYLPFTWLSPSILLFFLALDSSDLTAFGPKKLLRCPHHVCHCQGY